jgi:hypothetical protein
MPQSVVDQPDDHEDTITGRAQDTDEDHDDYLTYLENEIGIADRQAHDDALQLTSVEQKCRDELQQYIATPSLRIRSGAGEYNNPFEWWSQHRGLSQHWLV